ncbi:MAG: hypothetical protein HY350_01330 [Candidatus Omnitrophica bacterium]|nr:hypothetical protein [Candidatus Omnitrophota bacterium]
MIIQVLDWGGKFFTRGFGAEAYNFPQIAGALFLVWLLFWLIVGLICLAYRIFITILVTRDAQKRGGNVQVWLTLTFLFGSMAVMPYLLIRKDVTEKNSAATPLVDRPITKPSVDSSAGKPMTGGPV